MFADFRTIHARNIGFSDVSYVKEKSPYIAFPLPTATRLEESKIQFNVEKIPHVFHYEFYPETFWDILKNKVHFFPSLKIDFGLVLSQKEIDYYVWNAYVTQSVFLQEPETVGDFGTTLVLKQAGDITLGPGQGVGGTLTAFTEGPASGFTDFYVYVTVPGETLLYLVETSVTRIIVFQLWADWNAKAEFEYNFDTQITTTTQNYEQRRPLLPSSQRTISFNHVDTTYGMMSNIIPFAQDKPMGVPIISEAFPVLSIDSDKMALTSRADLTYFWNLKKYCNHIIITDREHVLTVKEVTKITGNKIDIRTPLPDIIPNQDALICFPMLTGYIKAANNKTLNSELVSWDLVFEELRGEQQPPLINVPALPTTFNMKLDWSKPAGFTHTLHRDIGEFPGTAQMIYDKFPKDKHFPMSHTGTLILKSKAEMSTFLDFIHAAKGRWKKFDYLFPFNQFKVIREEYAEATELRMERNLFYMHFPKITDKRIIIYYRGQTFNTTLVSVVDATTYMRVTFAGKIPWQIYEEDMHLMKFAMWKTVRFDLDSFKFIPKAPDVFEVNIRLVEVFQ